MNSFTWILAKLGGSTLTSRPSLAAGLWALTMSLWVLLILVAIMVAQSTGARRQPQAWKATRALATNHLLTASDLQPGNLAGYVRRPIKALDPISTDDLVPAPSLTPPSGLLVVLLPLTKGTASDKVDASQDAQVCVGGKPLTKLLTVQAVFCAPGQPCLAAVRVPPDIQAGLKADATVQPASPPGAQVTCG